MQFFTRLGAACALLLASALPSTAQDIDPDRWQLSENGAELVSYLGRESLKLSGGGAELLGEPFRNGTISFDLAMEEKRGFSGVYFRWNDNNAEYFYLRPHMSGKVDANQYTPRFNGLTGWQIYHSPRFSVPASYKFNDWTHVKLVVRDNKMDVYIDSDEPVLHVDNLMGPEAAGSVRFVGAMQDFHLSNVTVVRDDSVETIGTPAERAPFPENLVTSFNVATSAVAADAVEAKPMLDPALLTGQVWTKLEVDESGSANLARVSGRTREANTLLVRTVLVADEAKTVRYQYGFSDRVTVFLNGEALAYGDDTYQTRDYRHLGTVGLYDSVFLPLQAGRNELVLAVTEGFGGWAVKAAMAPVEGVRVE